jgi:hypothetical protein
MHRNREAGIEFTFSELNVLYRRKQKYAVLQTASKSWKAFRGLKGVKFPQLEDETSKYTTQQRGTIQSEQGLDESL